MAGRIFFLLVISGILAGCTPSGPGALLDGKRLIEKGKYRQAVEKLKTSTTLLATNAQAWNYLGLAYHYSGQSGEAEKAYQRALFYNHDLTEAHYNLGCLWLEQSKTNAARTEFIAFTLRRPNSPEGLLKLGVTQLRARDFVAAEKSFTDSLRLNSKNPEALNGLGLAQFYRGRQAQAVQCFKTALRQQPGYRPALLNWAIVSQHSVKERPFAVGKYREYLALKPPPQNADAVKATLRELEEQLNPPRVSPATNIWAQPTVKGSSSNVSATEVTRLTSLIKPEPVTNAPKATFVTELPKPAPSANSPKQVATSSSPPVPVEVVKVSPQPVFKSAQDVSQASARPQFSPYDVLLTNPPSLTHLGESGRYIYKSPLRPTSGNHAEAERWFVQGIEAQKGHRVSEALQAYRAATERDPAYFEAHYNLGLAAAEGGNLPAALMAYEYALTLRPDSVDARYSFALALKQANFLPDAANEFEKVLAKAPNEARAHLALGNLYSQQFHDPARARQHYLKVLENDPHSTQASAIHFWLTENP